MLNLINLTPSFLAAGNKPESQRLLSDIGDAEPPKVSNKPKLYISLEVIVVSLIDFSNKSRIHCAGNSTQPIKLVIQTLVGTSFFCAPYCPVPSQELNWE